MRIKNSGNIKLASLLFILGSASAVLLIPAVVQKETISSATGSVIGAENSSITDSLVMKAEDIKKEYIEVPISKVVDSTTEITKYIKEPQKVVSQENKNPDLNIKNNSTLGLNTQNNASIISSEPGAMIKITKQMIDNCKIITDEYNKVSK